MNVDLSVDCGGLKLRNPIIVGPSDITWSADLMKKAADAGAGAITVKTQHLALPMDKRSAKERGYKLFRLTNAEKGYDIRLANQGAYFTLAIGGPAGTFKSEEILPEVAKAKKIINVPIITSITSSYLDEIEKMAKMNAEVGADAIEIIDPLHYTYLYGAQRPDYTIDQAVKVVKQTTHLPVSAKLTFGWEDPVETVKKLGEAGADIVVAIGGANSLMGLEIDVETGKPIMNSHYLGCYGSWFKPYSVSWIARASDSKKVSVVGISGITKWSHAVEYIMAGATAVEICTILYVKGFRVIGEILNGLSTFMERKNYKKIDDFRGVGLNNLVSKEEIQKTFVPRLACVEEVKCMGCGICAEVCLNEAPVIKDKKAHVDPAKCQGCELCPQVCPVGAVTLVERKTE